jgi:MFS family permease
MLEQIRQRLLGPPSPESEEAGIVAGYPDFRRNYSLGIANGVLFNNGLSFFNRTTVIPVFLSGLNAPSVLISLTSLFEVLGWHLPQLFASKFIVHRPLKLPLYKMAAIIRMFGLALAIVSALMAASTPFWALLCFILGYGLFAMAGGLAGIVFTEVLAKTVPKEKRGTYFGWRAILSGIIGLNLGVYLIKPIFARLLYPYSFLLVFSIGTVLIGMSFWLFLLQKEPVQSDLPPKRTLKVQLTTARGILRDDRAFRRFVFFRGLMMLWFAGIPFYMLFAKDRLGATEAEIGTFISWEFAGLIMANLLWGYLSNRVGNKTLLIVACFLGLVVSTLLVLFVTGAVALPAWSFGMVFFLSAAVDSGVGNGGLNYALEIVPEAERPTYIGLMNSLLAGALGIAALSGALRDIIGYEGLFGMTGVIALLSLVMITRLPEPRRNSKFKIMNAKISD